MSKPEDAGINPRIIRKSSIVVGVPARWAAQYPRGRYSPDKDLITDRLLGLEGDALTAARVDAIIGNTSWTANRCDGCDRDCDTLVRLGEDPDYEAQWLDLCADCINEVYAFAANVSSAHTSKNREE